MGFATAAAIISAIAGTASTVHSIEQSKEIGRQKDQAKERTEKQVAAQKSQAAAQEKEMKEKERLQGAQDKAKERQRALRGGEGRKSTILTQGLGGTGGGVSGAGVGGKTVLGA